MLRFLLALINLVRTLFCFAYLLVVSKPSKNLLKTADKRGDDPSNTPLRVCVIDHNSSPGAAAFLRGIVGTGAVVKVLRTGENQQQQRDSFGCRQITTSTESHVARALCSGAPTNRIRPGVAIKESNNNNSNQQHVIFQHGNDENSDRVNRRWEPDMQKWRRACNAAASVNTVCGAVSFLLSGDALFTLLRTGSLSATVNRLKVRLGSSQYCVTFMNPLFALCSADCWAKAFGVSSDFLDKVVHPAKDSCLSPQQGGGRCGQSLALPACYIPLLEQHLCTFSYSKQLCQEQCGSIAVVQTGASTVVVDDAVVDFVAPSQWKPTKQQQQHQSSSAPSATGHTVRWSNSRGLLNEEEFDVVAICVEDTRVARMLLHSHRTGGKHRPGAFGFLLDSLLCFPTTSSGASFLPLKTMMLQNLHRVSSGIHVVGCSGTVPAAGTLSETVTTDASLISGLRAAAAVRGVKSPAEAGFFQGLSTYEAMRAQDDLISA